jgi:hypothetical protein
MHHRRSSRSTATKLSPTTAESASPPRAASVRLEEKPTREEVLALRDRVVKKVTIAPDRAAKILSLWIASPKKKRAA